MITLRNIYKVFGDEILFKDVNVTINHGDKISIVGDNGVGKTTLLKIIRDDNLASAGEVIYDGKTIGYLSQKVIEDFDNTIIEEYQQMFKELTNIELKMQELLHALDKNPEDNDLLIEYGDAETKFLSLGGYTNKIDFLKTLSLFGFKKDVLERKISSFSGGEVTKIALVKLLISQPDYLLLDEPTNHLDIQTIEWLEKYLKSYPKTIIIISHDRYFIDRVATKTIEIENSTINIYNTNYTNYIKEKAIRYNHQLANYERELKERKTLEEFIEKWRGKPSKIGQVNDRKKKIEHLSKIQQPLNNLERINFEFSSLNLKKSAYIEILDGTIGYEQTALIKNLNFRINGGDKIGIIGPNGIGKTTLLKTMLKQIPIIDGQAILHHKIKIGYFAQQQNIQDENKTILEVIKPYFKDNSDSYVRKYLGQFLFTKNDVFKKIKVLSGGERVRVELAQFALEKYDMIVLDEPTNHLDLKSKEVLEDALKTYKGTIICVSHDRYFMNQVIESYVFIQPDGYSVFEGKYDDYVDHITHQKMAKIKVKKAKVITSKKINKQEQKLEKSILKQEEAKELLIIESMKEEVYQDYQKSSQISSEIEELTHLITKLYLELDAIIE